MKYIPYGRQEITRGDIDSVVEALQAPFITQGPRIDEFEERLAEAVGARYAVAFNSGTAALHAAYAAAGIGGGRSVLTSAITFAATSNAALYLGGGVEFADIDPSSAQLDPQSVAEVATADVALVVPVHLGGSVGDMDALSSLAAERGWSIVEDASHAIGARYRTSDGREHRVGACAHSEMCCFSFHPVKHLTTGEGGATTTNDSGLCRRLTRFRSHGTTRLPDEMTCVEGPWYYEQIELGFNYRITDFQCALGRSQLERLTESVERRREVAARYDDAFSSVAGVRPVESPAASRGSFHLYVVRVDRRLRKQVFEGLRAEGIGVNVHYIPVYRHPYYRRHGFRETYLQHAEDYYAEAITLPMFPGLSDSDVDRVVSEVERQVALATASE